jgi:hypothetical protein
LKGLLSLRSQANQGGVFGETFYAKSRIFDRDRFYSVSMRGYFFLVDARSARNTQNLVKGSKRILESFLVASLNLSCCF